MKIMNKLQNRKEELKKNNKGFSLVELIIVIAIMAILVGIVGTQVIPYINKSKLEKDRQIVSSYSTAAVSAYSMVADQLTATPAAFDVYGTGLDANQTLVADEIKKLTYATCPTDKFKSKEASGAASVIITFNETNHTVEAKVTGTGTGKADVTVTSDM